MAHSRYPCKRCRTPIDTDYVVCPFCETENPLGYRRTRRVVLTFVVILGGALAVAAWGLG